MTHKILALLSSIIFIGISSHSVYGQWEPSQGCVLDPNDECIPNTLLTAVPFLRIAPDARGGAMGDVGVATTSDAYALHYNASKLAFADDDSQFSASYVPWLRNLGLNDVYMAYLGGYTRIDDLQSFGFDARFFSLGEITFTDINGGVGKFRELSLLVAGDNATATIEINEPYCTSLVETYIEVE